MQILEDLWNGDICPALTAKYREEDSRELESLLEGNEKNLLPTLNMKQQEALQKIKDLWEEIEHIRECSAFIAGFRLAVQLMTASV